MKRLSPKVAFAILMGSAILVYQFLRWDIAQEEPNIQLLFKQDIQRIKNSRCME